MDQNAQKLTNVQKAPLKTVKDWIASDNFKDAIQKSLPKHITPDRFTRVALTALLKTPGLQKCSKESVFQCLLDCSSLGLEPDGRRAHLIPYKTQCQLIIDYKGLIELAKRSGEIKTWRAELVCQNDEFNWENGIITHKVNWLEPRGDVLCVYSHVRNHSDVDEYEIMTLEEVEKIKNRSKAKSSGPWVTDFNEMAKKTVIRRHSKKLTLSPEFREALEKDYDKPEDIKAEYTLNEIKPERISEAAIEVDLDPDPESKAGTESLNMIMSYVKDSGGLVTKESLNDMLKREFGISVITDLLEKDVNDVCFWIDAQLSEG